MSAPDPLLRYVLDARPLHEGLRRALIQLSGFLLKQLTDERGCLGDFEPVEAARAGLCEAAESLRGLRAPPAAAHQHLHLDGAASALQRALDAALSPTDPSRDALFHFLEEAERHLRAVSRTTPGFETVDLRQACCACGRQLAAPAEAHIG